LFLCQTLPYPPDGGVQIRTYNVLRLLSTEFEVTALCFYRWKGGTVQRELESSLAALRELCEVEAFPIPQEHSRARFVWDHLRSMLFRRVYTWFAHESREYERRLRQLLRRESFDLVHVDSLDLARYLRLVGDIPIVCVHHNVESALLSRRAAVERRPWARAYLRHQARLTRREEVRWCPRVALNVAVSEEDRAQLQRIAPAGEYMVVPNGVDLGFFRPRPGGEDGLVFVGGNTWFPNRDALQYFCEAILPHIRSGGLQPRVRWVGRASESEVRYYRERYSVDLTGYVEDIRPYVADAACYVVPLRVGGGTRLKILDAWGMGKAIVSTSVGCEGLAVVDGENMLVRDTPDGFAAAIRAVLEDGGLRRRLEENGRRTAETRYSWKVIGGPMIDRYLTLALRETARQTAKDAAPPRV
jgi:glycosyltransferase involved in cell wall biosynthesis